MKTTLKELLKIDEKSDIIRIESWLCFKYQFPNQKQELKNLNEIIRNRINYEIIKEWQDKYLPKGFHKRWMKYHEQRKQW